MGIEVNYYREIRRTDTEQIRKQHRRHSGLNGKTDGQLAFSAESYALARATRPKLEA